MYATGPPVAHQGGGVCLVRAERMAFAGPAEFLADPVHRIQVGRYLSDLARPYGLELRDRVFDGVAVTPDLGHSYGEMAEALIGAAVPPDEPVDLLVLAFAIHDVRPGRATATYLSHVCPGRPMAFAVCDQGTAAAFTALRLVREYLLAGAGQRALLLVVEQAGLPYDAPPVPMPTQHTGVALVMVAGDAAAPLVGPVRQHAGAGPERVGPLLATGVAAVGDDPLVLLGAGLAGYRSHVTAGEVRVAPESRPGTGVWWEAAGAGADRRPVLLADYDPALRYLCLCPLGRG